MQSTGTGNPEDYPCPIGYYCPAGSAEPTPCPVGQYGNIVRAVSSDQCQPCQPNTFNNMLGQQACRPCGSSAAAVEGRRDQSPSLVWSFQFSTSYCEMRDLLVIVMKRMHVMIE